MKFKDLKLSKEILKAIDDIGYTEATPIQEKAIPVILERKDILAGAQTGTGKTAGFTLPILQLLSQTTPVMKKFHIRTLILTPTRELAIQIGENINSYAKYLPFKSTVVFGGVGINPQKAHLRRGVDILTATPGRLLDLIGQKAVDLSSVEFFVLDEADRMLDMGFIHDIKKILKLLPKKKQTLLFSATFSANIKKLANELLNNPVLIEVAKSNSSASTINQTVHFVDKKRKRELLSHLIRKNNWKQVLVFTRTKHGANKLSKQLIEDGITSAAIHGNKSQGARTKALSEFKSGEIRVLVATDIAARGIDIEELPHVINFELPNVSEDYIHRIGRTGRAGNLGEAISLVCIDEKDYLKDIEKLMKKDINKIEIEGFKPDPTIKAEKPDLRKGSPKSRCRNNKQKKNSKTSNRRN